MVSLVLTTILVFQGPGSEVRGQERWADQNMPMRKMIAMYDYDPHELSPNVDAEVLYINFLCIFGMRGSVQRSVGRG